MKHIFFIGLLSVLFQPLFAQQKKWKLIWSDEFNYTGLPDSSKWNYETGGNGWGNNEKEYYTEKSLKNSFVKDGKLHIVGLKEDYGNQNYTSARLTTYHKFSFQ
ncbi:MAG: glycoside hydrolase family 16 protein, partial [Bacteroidetes bacterium]|nr:glycoside hydrolase family 16 protein [Bacteroidota bacterium]